MRIIREISTGQNRLTYRLTESTNENGKTVYGVSAESELFGKKDCAVVKDVTSEHDFAERLLYALVDNSVLPSVLCETVCEYVTAAFTV